MSYKRYPCEYSAKSSLFAVVAVFDEFVVMKQGVPIFSAGET